MKENVAVLTEVNNQFNSILLYCVYINKHTLVLCTVFNLSFWA